jgi:hypothetical protein
MGAFAMRDLGREAPGTLCRALCLVVLGVTALCADARYAHAGCALPPAFGIMAEEHGLLDRGSSGVVITVPATEAGLAAGDVVRQANGVRVKECADLERAAADALAQGLVLLLAVERGDARIALAVTTRASATREGTIASSSASKSAPPPAAVVAPAPAAEARAAGSSQIPVPHPLAVAPPPPRREVALPPHAGASEALVRRAEAAAAALANVDAAARLVAPLALYERRLGEAEAAIATLEFGVGTDDSAVHDFVEDALALHRTARDVRRLQLEIVSQTGLDRRAPAASGLPYFSTSKVPQWVQTYPFLEACILEPPREIRIPVPGEIAGRWSPDQALELLWDRTRTATTALTAWSRGG